MPDGFNMVTAMETIHRHIHAVGCGALPSCWMTGDPSFFCRADGLFVPIPVADAVLIDYERDAGRVAQACGRVELRRVPFFSGLQCFVWTTSLGCAIGGYNLSFRYGAPNPTNPGFWDIL